MYFAVKYFYINQNANLSIQFFFKSLEGILLWTKIWFELLKYRLLLPVLFLYIWTLYRWSNKSSEVWLYLTIYQYFYDILFACLMIKPSIISYACVFWNKKNVFTETQQQMHLSGCLLFQCWHCNNFTK